MQLPGDARSLLHLNAYDAYAHSEFCEWGGGSVLSASISSAIGTLFILGALAFFGFIYLTGRVLGAGVRIGGDLWRTGQHQADQRNTQMTQRPTQPAPPSSAEGWYKDPWGTGRRYWNGHYWTEHTHAN